MMESKNIPIDGSPVEASSSVGSGVSLGLLATLAGGAYIVGRFSKSESAAPLPSLGTLAMTYVVFRALDFAWPTALKAVTETTLPGSVGGISQAFRTNMSGLFGAPQTFRNTVPSPGQRVVDGYTVK